MQKLLTGVTSFVALLVVTFFSLSASAAVVDVAESNRNALADIVDQQCLPNFHRRHSPWPCNHVNLAKDYVIMQDVKGSGHYLLIAISPLPGIEASALLTDASPLYFQNAWQHRGIVAATRGTAIDDQDIGVLVNSMAIRTQDRLHFHIAPLHRPFARLLMRHKANITRDGATLMWEGRPFHIWKITERALAHTNPLALIAQRSVKAAQDIPDTAFMLAAAGKNAQGENELYVIEIYYPQRTSDGWFPEDLLDWRSVPIAIRHKQSAGT